MFSRKYWFASKGPPYSADGFRADEKHALLNTNPHANELTQSAMCQVDTNLTSNYHVWESYARSGLAACHTLNRVCEVIARFVTVGQKRTSFNPFTNTSLFLLSDILFHSQKGKTEREIFEVPLLFRSALSNAKLPGEYFTLGMPRWGDTRYFATGKVQFGLERGGSQLGTFGVTK